MSVQVLIAEDDPLLRELLALKLAESGDVTVVGRAGGGREALEAVRLLHPHVLLLDLNLPDLSGWKVLERLAETEPSPPVLVLSGEEDLEAQLRAARSGARGFLEKSRAFPELTEAIQAVAAGRIWFSASVVVRIMDEYPVLARGARAAERPLGQLTETERRVLTRLARGESNQRIAEGLFMSISTVKTHLRSVFRKLNLPNRTEAAIFAIREGLGESDP